MAADYTEHPAAELQGPELSGLTCPSCGEWVNARPGHDIWGCPHCEAVFSDALLAQAYDLLR
jgi:ribosomal protein L37AE/L43A